MKEKFLNLVISGRIAGIYCVLTGAIMGGLFYGIGRNVGNVEGITEANGNWKAALDEAKRKYEEDVNQDD